MSILLSVNPPFAGWLVDGEKTIEWRKKPLPEGTAFIYETKKNGGSGMVIGKVYILRSTKEDVGDLFGKMYDQFSTVPDIMNFLKEGKISKEDLVNGFKYFVEFFFRKESRRIVLISLVVLLIIILLNL